jgi:ATP phosphoribosyltransferase
MKRRDDGRLRIAIQKSGRLSDRSKDLLARCGVTFEWRPGRLDARSLDFPIDILLVRDDDIPRYVADGVCDLGVVGENVIEERLGLQRDSIRVVRKLDFGKCRLSLAVPKDSEMRSVKDLDGCRIATSYPFSTARYFAARDLKAEIVEISGSVEIAPSMGVADAICDLVSTGATLSSHGLEEIEQIYESQAVLITTAIPLTDTQEANFQRLHSRLSGVLRAEKAKYIMMNAPRTALDRIRALIPGLEEPTVVPLSGDGQRVAIHAVAPEPIFWETMELLKAAGASSILVVPIEKVIE